MTVQSLIWKTVESRVACIKKAEEDSVPEGGHSKLWGRVGGEGETLHELGFKCRTYSDTKSLNNIRRNRKGVKIAHIKALFPDPNYTLDQTESLQ